MTMHVNDPRTWRTLLRGSLGVADAYIDGEWDCDDLVTLVRIAAREVPRLDRLRRAVLPLRRLLERVPRNTPGGSAGTSPPTTTSATSYSPPSSTRR